MTWLKRIAALGAAGVLAAGAGSAFAQPAESAGNRPPVDPAVACERAENLLGKLQGLTERLEKRIAALEARIAGGQLTPEQLAGAEARLAKLERVLERLEAAIAKLEARIAAHCTEASPA
jgi:hypothetical protein